MSTAPPVADFATDTAVAPAGEGRWRATLSPAWMTFRSLHGGYVAAVAVRALEAAAGDPSRAPRSLSLQYLRTPVPGPVDIETTVERTGRTMTAVSLRMRQDGRAMVVGVGSVGRAFPVVLDYQEPAPSVAPPGALVASPGALAALDQPHVVLEQAFGAPLLSGAATAELGGWVRFADRRPVDAAALALFADVWMPAPWTRLAQRATIPTIDLTIHFRVGLPPGGLAGDEPVLTRFRSAVAADGYVEEDGELWAADGTLLAQSRQLCTVVPPA